MKFQIGNLRFDKPSSTIGTVQLDIRVQIVHFFFIVRLIDFVLGFRDFFRAEIHKELPRINFQRRFFHNHRYNITKKYEKHAYDTKHVSK